MTSFGDGAQLWREAAARISSPITANVHAKAQELSEAAAMYDQALTEAAGYMAQAGSLPGLNEQVIGELSGALREIREHVEAITPLADRMTGRAREISHEIEQGVSGIK